MKTDPELRQYVIDELYSNPELDATGIGVDVDNGIVTLSGHVSSLPAKDAAERTVLHVAGVRSVLIDLKVVLPYESFRTDFEIGEEAQFALKWNAIVPEGQVQATVESAVVTLTGCVDHAFQKKAAEGAVRQLLGVKSIIDLVTIEAAVEGEEILSAMARTLNRTIDHALKSLIVESHSGVITLRGEVASWADREEAERAALKQHGVSDVNNLLTIGA